MEKLRRVVESLYVRVGGAVAGVGSIAVAVVSRWPNPWLALAIAVGAALVALAVLSFILDLAPKRAAVTAPASVQTQRRIDLRHWVVWSPQPNGGYKPRLHMEAVNTSERNLSLAQWTAEQPGGPAVGGSPYEGRVKGPRILKPTQLHGWDIPLDSPGGRFRSDLPMTVTVRLTTGEQFVTGPISPPLSRRPPA